MEIKEPEPIPEKFRVDPSLEETKKVVEEVKKYQKEYWKCLMP